MGTSKENRTRLRLEEKDLYSINILTRSLMNQILESFSTSPIQNEEWPLRYLLLRNQIEYEFIFSQMGSCTLRVAKSDRYKKNPPPIFYISLGKYEENVFVWEDLNAVEIDISKDVLNQKINESILVYESAISSI